MKSAFVGLLLIGLVYSCKPYTSTTTKPDQITYTQFRNDQSSFSSIEGTIKYIDKGKGEVILLLHGIPTSGWLYRNMIDELAKTNRVIVPDMLGFGSSDSPKGYEIYSEENHGRRILALMDSLNIEKWTHVMHDAGGLWTWELLKQESHRFKNLVILNTIIYEEGFQPPIRFKKGFTARIAMWSYRNKITTNMMLRGLLKSGLIEHNLNKTDIEGYKIPLKEGKTRGMYYFFTQTCNELPNYSEVLSQFKRPVTIIWGEEDEFLLWQSQANRVKSDLNISEENIHLLKAKHFIQEEEPQEIIKIILQSLK